MKETRFFFVPDAANETELPMDEAMHALRVLRLKSGDEMFLMDGNGTFYRAEVTIAATKHCMYEINEALPQQKGWTGYIHLAMAPPQSSKSSSGDFNSRASSSLTSSSVLNTFCI